MTPMRVMKHLPLKLRERPPLPLEQQVKEKPPGRIGERSEHLAVIYGHRSHGHCL